MSKSLPASVLSSAQLLEQQSPAPPPLDRHGRITGYQDLMGLGKVCRLLGSWFACSQNYASLVGQLLATASQRQREFGNSETYPLSDEPAVSLGYPTTTGGIPSAAPHA